MPVQVTEGMGSDGAAGHVVGEMVLIVEETTAVNLSVVEREAVSLTVEETEIDLTAAETTAASLTVTEQTAITLIVNEGTASMALAKWELDPVVRGANNTQRMTFKEADGSAFSLLGHTIHWTLRRREKDDKALLEKSSLDSDQIEVIAPSANGIADLKIVPADTKDLEPGKYVHDVWIQKSTGEMIPVVRASLFNLIWEVSRLS